MKNLRKEQIALSNFPYYKYSLDYALDSLQRQEAGPIEFYACDPHYYMGDASAADTRVLKSKLKERGLRVINWVPEQVKYPINIASTNPVRAQKSIEYYVKCIQAASELECPTVQFFAGWGTLDSRYEDTWKRSVAAVAYLSQVAKGYGVDLLLEAAFDTDTVIYDTTRIKAMMQDVGADNLHALIDLYCLSVCGEDIDRALTNLDNQVSHVHFSDAGFTNISSAHMVPGEGNLDLDYIMNAFDRIDYKGYFSVELLAPYERHPEEAMRKTAQWLRARML